MDTLPVINRTYEVYKTVVDINNHLDKRWRYSIGQSLELTILDCLKELVMAKNAPKSLKSAYLLKASSHLEIALLKLRLCLEFELVNETKIFQAQQDVSEIGRQVGGWLRSLQ